MTAIVALCSITGGINVHASADLIKKLGFAPQSFSLLSPSEMNTLRGRLEDALGPLPDLCSGGSVANSIDLLGRLGFECGVMGLAGKDQFGQQLRANFRKGSVTFVSELEEGLVTGYDFYLYDEQGRRSIALTHGANAALSPEKLNEEVIGQAELLLLEGGCVSVGPNSRAALDSAIACAWKNEVPYVLTLPSAGVVAKHQRFFLEQGAGADLLFGNLEEVAALTGQDKTASFEEVREALRSTSINVLVTLDARGAFASMGDVEVRTRALPVELVDVTGAGDHFLGAFLGARMRGCSLKEAMTVGHGFAAEVIQCRGARLPLRRNIPELFQKVLRDARDHGE